MQCSQCTKIPLICVFHSSVLLCLSHYKNMLYIQRLEFCLEFFLIIFVVVFLGLGVAITSVYASRLLKREWRVRAGMSPIHFFFHFAVFFFKLDSFLVQNDKVCCDKDRMDMRNLNWQFSTNKNNSCKTCFPPIPLLSIIVLAN